MDWLHQQQESPKISHNYVQRQGPLDPTDPLLISLKSELENNPNIHADHRRSMDLHLPIPMQTKADTISQKAGKNGGVVVLID